MVPNQAASAPSRPAPARSPVAIVLPVLVLITTLALIGWSLWPTVRPARKVRVVQVMADPSAQQADVVPDDATPEGQAEGGRRTVQAPGWLEAEPFYVACSALTNGVLESIDVLEGDRVTAGQVVATMVQDDAQLRVARAEAALATAASAVRSAEAEQVAARTNWDEPFELERAVDVAAASLAEARAERARLESVIESARATLVLLREELERTESSLEGFAAAELEVVRARQRFEAQQATLEAHEAERPLLDARITRLEAELRAAERGLALRIEDRRRLDAAGAVLASAEAARTAAAVELDEARLELERMVIRAPISGYVQRRLKVPGDKVMLDMDSPHSAHIVHLYDPERLQVRVDVPLADAAQVYVGQRCEVIVEVLPDVTFPGRVLRVTHEADLQKNTLQAKVAVENPSPILRPEMLTRVKFLARGGGDNQMSDRGQASRSPHLVPATAVDESGRVFAVVDRERDRGFVRPVSIELLSTDNGWARVRGDVEAGMLLIDSPIGVHQGEVVKLIPEGNG